MAGTNGYQGSRLPALTDTNFTRLALEARNYTLVMLFLVRNVKYQVGGTNNTHATVPSPLAFCVFPSMCP